MSRERILAQSKVRCSRGVVLDWFKSLTISERKQVLTSFDKEWIRIVSTMMSQLLKKGWRYECLEYVRFIIEPPQKAKNQLITGRGCKSLLGTRKKSVNMTSKLQHEGQGRLTVLAIDILNLYQSREFAIACTTLQDGALISIHGDSLSINFSSSLVEDVNTLINICDTISRKHFLCEPSNSEPSHDKISQWHFMPWLSRREMYSLGEILANHIEISLLNGFAFRKSASLSTCLGTDSKICSFINSMQPRDHFIEITKEYSLAMSEVLKQPRNSLENAMFKEGILGGWPVLSFSPPRRYWELDWVNGYPSNALLSLKALTELLPCLGNIPNLSLTMKKQRYLLVEKLVTVPLHCAYGLSGMLCMNISKRLESRAISFAKAELLKGLVEDFEPKKSVQVKSASKNKKKQKAPKKNLRNDSSRVERIAKKPEKSHENPAAAEMDHWYTNVMYSSANSSKVKNHTRTQVLVYSIIQSVIDNAVQIAHQKYAVFHPPPKSPKKLHPPKIPVKQKNTHLNPWKNLETSMQASFVTSLVQPPSQKSPKIFDPPIIPQKLKYTPMSHGKPPEAPLIPCIDPLIPSPLSPEVWPFLGEQRKVSKPAKRFVKKNKHHSEFDEISVSSFDSMDVRVEEGDVGGDLIPMKIRTVGSKFPLSPSIDEEKLLESMIGWPPRWQHRDGLTVKGRFTQGQNENEFGNNDNLGSGASFNFTANQSWLSEDVFSNSIFGGTRLFSWLPPVEAKIERSVSDSKVEWWQPSTENTEIFSHSVKMPAIKADVSLAELDNSDENSIQSLKPDSCDGNKTENVDSLWDTVIHDTGVIVPQVPSQSAKSVDASIIDKFKLNDKHGIIAPTIVPPKEISEESPDCSTTTSELIPVGEIDICQSLSNMAELANEKSIKYESVSIIVTKETLTEKAEEPLKAGTPVHSNSPINTLSNTFTDTQNSYLPIPTEIIPLGKKFLPPLPSTEKQKRPGFTFSASMSDSGANAISLKSSSKRTKTCKLSRSPGSKSVPPRDLRNMILLHASESPEKLRLRRMRCWTPTRNRLQKPVVLGSDLPGGTQSKRREQGTQTSWNGGSEHGWWSDSDRWGEDDDSSLGSERAWGESRGGKIGIGSNSLNLSEQNAGGGVDGSSVNRTRTDDLFEDNVILRNACLRLESELAKLKNVLAVAVANSGPNQGQVPSSVSPRGVQPPGMSHMVIPEHSHVAWEVMSDDGRGPISLQRQQASCYGHIFVTSNPIPTSNSFIYYIPEQQDTSSFPLNAPVPNLEAKESTVSEGDAITKPDFEGGAQPPSTSLPPGNGGYQGGSGSGGGGYGSSQVIGCGESSTLAALSENEYVTLRRKLEVQTKNFGIGLGISPSISGRPNSNVLRSRLSRELHEFVQFVVDEDRRRFDAKWIAYHRCRMVVRNIWPRAQAKLYGSFITGLGLPWSDLDLLIWLPKVRKDAPAVTPGALEGRNAIKESWQQELARSLSHQPWVEQDSIKIISHTAVPVIKLLTKGFTIAARKHTSKHPPPNNVSTLIGGKTEFPPVHVDVSFEGQFHNGQASNGFVLGLIGEYPSLRPLVMVLKQFLKERGLCESYTGGLSSYALILIVARYLQEQTSNLDAGSLLQSFLDFFGNSFDPRTTGISVSRRCYFSRLAHTPSWPSTVQSSSGIGGQVYFPPHPIPTHPNRRGLHLNSAGSSIYNTGGREGVPYRFDPLFIEDPLSLGNNVGRNCFRIYQIKRAWSDAHAALTRAMENIDTHPILASSKGENSGGLCDEGVPLLRNLILPFRVPE